jgi:two-component system cell cycle sensor histidine kinase/response regulator CckA
VDDEEDLAHLFGDVLTSRGYTVEVFTDPSKASEKIQAEHEDYSLVLTDVKMPGLTGVELGKQILAIDEDVKIILISAYELMENPGLQYIKKPIGVSQLIELVESKLTSSQN